MLIVDRIKILCTDRNLSIPKLEEKLGFGRGAIYNWDTNSPSVNKVQKAAEFLGVSIDFLVQGHCKNAQKSFTTEELIQELASRDDGKTHLKQLQQECMDEITKFIQQVSLVTSKTDSQSGIREIHGNE